MTWNGGTVSDSGHQYRDAGNGGFPPFAPQNLPVRIQRLCRPYGTTVRLVATSRSLDEFLNTLSGNVDHINIAFIVTCNVVAHPELPVIVAKSAKALNE